MRDRVAATTTRVSVGSGGAEGNGNSCYNQGAAISADGRFVAFDSDATNLALGDTNGMTDVFARDRVTGTTTRVSVDSAGAESSKAAHKPALSADGRFVAFTWAGEVFLRDRGNGKMTRVSAPTGGDCSSSPGGGGDSPSISADGRFVAFGSESPFAPGDTNGKPDIYVYDRTVIETTVSRLGIAIKKRRKTILVTGLVCPTLSGRTVNVALFRRARHGNRFVRVGARRATLDAASKFRVTFRRPRSGWCKVTARFPGGPNLSSDFRSFTVRCKL